MKKGKILFLLTIVYLLIPIFVSAKGIHFNSPTKKADRVYEFVLTAEDIYSNLNFITGDLYLPNAKITNIKMSSNWKNATGNSTHFYFYRDGGLSGTFTIATFEITISGDSYYKVSNVNQGFNKCITDIYNNYFGEKGTLVSRDTYYNTCVVSKDATLKSLSISNGVLSPSFNPALELYSATVENDVQFITFNAIPNHAKAVVSNTYCALKVGVNACKISVKSESGNTKTYTVTVTRKRDTSGNSNENVNGNPHISSDPSIGNLEVYGGKLKETFQSNKKEYHVEVDKSASSVYFTFTINSNGQKFTSNKCSALADICNLTVTAEDGETKTTYKFYFVRDDVSTNNTSTNVSNKNNSSTSSSSSKKENNTTNNLATENKKPQTQNNSSSANNTNSNNNNNNTTTTTPIKPNTNTNTSTEENTKPNDSVEENETQNNEEIVESIEKEEENKYALKYLVVFLAGFAIIGILILNRYKTKKRMEEAKKKPNKKKEK